MMDELELGLPPRKEKPLPPPRTDIEWRKNAGTPRMCDDCVEETPKVNGVPVHAIDFAYYVRRAPDSNGYYCSKHADPRRRADGKE